MSSMEGADHCQILTDLPYIDPTIFYKFPFKEGDIVISVPIKCGTNWTMFLVYSILTEGLDTSFKCLYERVPWIEFKWNPGQSLDERIAILERVEYRTPGHRTFKSHIPVHPGPLPYRDDVKYIFTARNPCDMLLSLGPFFNSHNDEFFELWGLSDLKGMLATSQDVVKEFTSGRFPRHVIELYKYAWNLRDRPNVLLLHFTDMKRNLRREASRVAAFLGQKLDTDALGRVVAHCDFKWMKDHEDQFNITSIGFLKESGEIVAPLKPQTLLRKGVVGEHEQQLTEQEKREIFSAVKEKAEDDELVSWIFNGFGGTT